jgi:hypothetical protein
MRAGAAAHRTQIKGKGKFASKLRLGQNAEIIECFPRTAQADCSFANVGCPERDTSGRLGS